jgi:hypothetical protein
MVTATAGADMSVLHLLRDSVIAADYGGIYVYTGVVVAAKLFTMVCEFLSPEGDKC